MKRRVLMTGIGVLLCVGAACQSRQTTAAPEIAEPFTEVVHGETVSDEYRWMEDGANEARLTAWVRARDAEARAEAARLPEHQRFSTLLDEISVASPRTSSVLEAGETTVMLRLVPGDGVAKLFVSRGAEERVLIDPNQTSGGPVVAINNVTLSPDGTRVAVHTAEGGAEVGAIQVYDIANGRPTGPPMRPVWGEFPLVWLDNVHVAYTRMADGRGGTSQALEGMSLFVKRVEDESAGSPVLGPGHAGVVLPLEEFPMLRSAHATPSQVSRWALAMGTGARRNHRFLLTDMQALATGRPSWVPVADVADMVTDGAVRGDSLFLISTLTNGNGTLTRRDIVDRRPGPPTVLLEGTEQLILSEVQATKDGVYVIGSENAIDRILFLPQGRPPARAVPLPLDGAVATLDPRSDGTGLVMGLTSWFTTRTFYRVAGGTADALGIENAPWPGVSGFTTLRHEATSADGTRVPMITLTPKARANEGAPALLNAYGSYGISTLRPRYDRRALAWLARGGVMSYCGTRGGGERGRLWHDAGRGLKKANAHADLVACAEQLTRERLATSRGPVLIGASAAGLLLPNAAMRQPYAFAAMVLQVGAVNPTRIADAPNGSNQFAEMGDPRTPEGYAALKAQDGYLALAAARDLPDTLLTIGLNDRRVPPAWSAKFAARALARFGRTRRIWLRADDDAGHGIGSEDTALRRESADILAFAWSRATK